MRAALEAAAIPTKPLRMNPAKTQAVGPALQALCSKDAELKVLSCWASGCCTSCPSAASYTQRHSDNAISGLQTGPYPMQLLLYTAKSAVRPAEVHPAVPRSLVWLTMAVDGMLENY